MPNKQNKSSSQWLRPISRALSQALIIGTATTALASTAQAAKGTFLVQLKDYDGENAYFTMYLVKPNGHYDKTLWISGPEQHHQKNLSRWWKYLGRAPQNNIDAITGASTPPGDRDVIRIPIDNALLNKGYKIRIASAVENQKHFDHDVEVPLDTAHQKVKNAGTGYVRYLRFKWE